MGPNVLYMWIKEEQTVYSILLTLINTTVQSTTQPTAKWEYVNG